MTVRGTRVFLFGGLLAGGEYTGTFTSDIQRIDLRTGRARVVGHLPVPTAHAMAAVIRGRILVMGGSTPSGTSRGILRLDPATGKVTRGAMLPEPLTDAGVASTPQAAYLLGGISSGPTEHVTVVRMVAAR